MVGIIIYTKKKKLRHKKNLRNICSFWKLRYFPKKFEPDEDRVYFAYDKHIQGHFKTKNLIHFYARNIPDTAVIFKPRWHPLETKIPIKNFQGFKYITSDPKLMANLMAGEV